MGNFQCNIIDKIYDKLYILIKNDTRMAHGFFNFGIYSEPQNNILILIIRFS
jgi:hypothetical protein